MGLALNVAKMAKQRSSHAAIEEAQYLMKNLSLRTEMRRSGVLSFWGITRWRLRYRKTPGYALSKPHAQMPSLPTWHHKNIRWHAGDAMVQVHLHPTDADSRLLSRLQSWVHLCRKHQPPQPVTLPQHNISKSPICRPDMCIDIYLFPVLNDSTLIHLPRIASTIQILIQICCLMKEHPLVITLSAVW